MIQSRSVYMTQCTMDTQHGQWRNMPFHVCGVTRPVASVHKIVEAGHSVVFTPAQDQRGSYIQHHNTGESMWLIAQDGVYVLETNVSLSNWQSSPSSAGQGR